MYACYVYPINIVYLHTQIQHISIGFLTVYCLKNKKNNLKYGQTDNKQSNRLKYTNTYIEQYDSIY